MATTLRPSPIHTPTSSNPPTPPISYPAFPRLSSNNASSSNIPSIQRNASTSSSRSTTTTSSTSSSLMAVPMRPPPIETRTAATTPSQLPPQSRSVEASASASTSAGAAVRREEYDEDDTISFAPGEMGYRAPQPQRFYGGRGFMRNGPRMGTGRQIFPQPPSIVTSPSRSPLPHMEMRDDELESPTAPSALGLHGTPTRAGGAAYTTAMNPPRASSLSPTTPRAPQPPWAEGGDDIRTSNGNGNRGSPSPDLPPRVMVTDSDRMSEHGSGSGSVGPGSPTSPLARGRGYASIPSSPTMGKVDNGGSDRAKQRTLSVDAGPSGAYGAGWNSSGRGGGRRDRSAEASERQRRMSQISNTSAGGGSSSGTGKKPSIRDFQIGEELGRGSYSTVVRATALAASSSSSSSSRPPRQYAIKIINQAHLIQEKKAKYAMIERDALVRLSKPRAESPTAATFRTHRRGQSGSSSAAAAGSSASAGGKKRSTPVSMAGQRRDSSNQIVQPGGKDRLSVATSDSSSSTALGASIPISPTLMAGRVPWRTEPLGSGGDRQEEDSSIRRTGSPLLSSMRSAPPSPVKEESSSHGHGDDDEQTSSRPSQASGAEAVQDGESKHGTPSRSEARQENQQKQDFGSLSPDSAFAPLEAAYIKGGANATHSPSPTPKKRRQSLAPSERSVKSTYGKVGQAHPGIIRLFSTFNDATSLYFVLDLAANGELLSFIRKYGSLDIESARFYAAQLIDAIEFMQERGVIHRDLKPENILLDEDMRIRITDFGSAKIVNKEEDLKVDEGRKRSFVGSADFVSPEVLRNEPAVFPSDIWAFGCILYQFITGKPPFRGATDYLTFQKILKKEMEYPEGFDEDAKALVELVLNLDPLARPTAQEIKAHPFFATTDFATLWTCQPPEISTGLVKPVATLATAGQDSDLWAVFDDEVSDGGFEYDNDDVEAIAINQRNLEPRYDHRAAADAVRRVDEYDIDAQEGSASAPFAEPHYPFQDAGSDTEAISADLDLAPPRPPYIADSPSGKRGRARLDSNTSGRTSSSSSTNRNALSGLLESIRIQGGPMFGTGGSKAGSSRNSRTSDRSAEVGSFIKESRGSGTGSAFGSRAASPSVETTEKQVQRDNDASKWTSLLLANERIIYTSSILVRPPTTIHLPSFLLPSPKRRQLILTDFPRLITVKEEPNGSLGIKAECVFVVRGSARSVLSAGSGNAGLMEQSASTGSDLSGAGAGSGGATRVLDVQEKGPKGFVVQTTSQMFSYTTDTAEIRKEWMAAIKRVQ